MATATVSAPEVQNEPISLNSRHWTEELWEDSGFPCGIWRRLRNIDAAARAASHIAQILAIDRQNRGLIDDAGKEYEPLSQFHAGGLSDAVRVLLDDVCNALDDLRDYPREFKLKIETSKETQP